LIAHIALKSQASLLISSGPGQVGSPLLLSTSGGSGTGLVSYEVTNGTAKGCSVKGTFLTATFAGTCIVTGTKAGDSDYASVQSAAVSLAFVAKGEIAPVTIQFSPGQSSLSSMEKVELTALAKRLSVRSLVTCTGYAVGNNALASQRANAVKTLLATRGILHFMISTVTNGHDNWATITASR